MPRLYHSPSSIKLGMRCRSAWARDYLLGLRAPRVTWAQIANKPNHPQRGAALGVAVHAVYEAWYTPGGAPKWDDHPGQVALSGAHLIPHPSKCEHVYSEGPIGRELLPADAKRDAHSPDRVLRVDGIPWGGFRDLLAHAPDEWARLDVKHNDGWGLVDYKSTGSIEKWALDADALAADLQANVYAIDVCELLGLSWIPGRWLYLETTAARRISVARDVRLELSRAHDIVGAANNVARELDTLHDAYHAGLLEIDRDVPKNAGACNDYRGCHHHRSRGGGCDAKAPPIMRLKRNVGGTLMALNPSLVKKQQDIANAASAAPMAAPVEANDAAEAPAADAEIKEQLRELAAEPVAQAPAATSAAKRETTRTQPKPAAKAAPLKGMRVDLAQPFTLAFEGGQLSADVLTLTKVVPAIGAARYELSQGDFAIEAEAGSLAVLLALLPAA